MVMAPAKTMVVDCDTHFWEPPEIWEKWVDPPLRERVRAAMAGRTLDMPAVVQEKTPAYRAIRGGLEPAERLKWMEAEGIYANIIYPSNVPASLHEDPEVAAAACRAINRWSAAFADADRKRFKPCMLLPMRHPDRALAELEYAAGTLGLEAVFCVPTPLGRRWSDPAYDPLWRAMEAGQVVLTFHEFSRFAEGAVARPFYRDSYPMTYLCGHVIELQLTVMDLIFGGMAERFPRLQIGFVEGHLAWLPGWLALMDDSFPRTSTFFQEKTGTGTLSLRPSEFFRRQMFVVGFPDDTWLPEFIQFLGADNLVLSTDYPHPQTRYGLIHQLDSEHPSLPEAVRRKILGENARRIFRLEW